MFNLLNLFIARETVSEPTEPEFVREDFTIPNYEAQNVSALLEMLRERTYDFVYENKLAWATTEFNYGDLPIAVTLNEDWNVLYTVNRHTTTSPKDAAAIIADAMQF